MPALSSDGCARVGCNVLILFMASHGMGRRLSQRKTGSRTCLGPTWDFQAGGTCQPRCGLRRRTHAQRGSVCASTAASTDSTAASISMPGVCTDVREPGVLTGRPGGTDVFHGRGARPPRCSLVATERALDSDNVFGTASCGDPGWNVAGAADAKEPTAIRELREKEEKSSQFRGATIDKGDH